MRVHYANEYGCSVTITEDEVYDWHHRPYAAWPCGTITKAIRVAFDGDGTVVEICDNNPEVDATEFRAMVSDLLRDASQQKWRPKKQREHLAEYAAALGP